MNKEILENVTSWRDAVCAIVDEKTKNEKKCFSSGEITKEIRTLRPDLLFSHWDVGEYVRDLYYSNSICYDIDDFGPEPAVQFSRFTSGKTRTPSGLKVFVYGPDDASAEAHDFEVEIPRCQGNLNDPYDEYGSLADEGPKLGTKESVQATVHADKRLCIPRSAFDSFMHKTGKKIAPGDKVHVTLDQAVKKVIVSLTGTPDSKPYDLTRDRGRVKFLPNILAEWGIGDVFDVDVTDNGIEIDVSVKASA